MNEKLLTLAEMPKEEAEQIWETWRSGLPLQWYQRTHERWREDGREEKFLCSDDIYRIPPVPFSVNDWSLFPEWCNYVTCSEGGAILLHESKPITPNIEESFWWSYKNICILVKPIKLIGEALNEIMLEDAKIQRGNVPWQECIAVRPGVES